MSRTVETAVSGRPRLRKWWILSGLWVVQGVVAYVGAAAWIALNGHSGGAGGPVYGFSIRTWLELMIDPDWAWRAAAGIGFYTAVQACFLMPVAKPGFSLDGRGTALWVSAAAAGLAVAGIWGAVVAAMYGAAQLIGAPGVPGTFESPMLLAMFVSMAIAWFVATPLVARFVSRNRREGALGRVSAAIFLGTAVESVAIVPLDVMMRRKTDCYCETGTFWALSATGTIGFFALGPAVLLPVLARRRKRWYAGKCDACGYDMTSTPRAERCPECGAGWKGGE